MKKTEYRFGQQRHVVLEPSPDETPFSFLREVPSFSTLFNENGAAVIGTFDELQAIIHVPSGVHAGVYSYDSSGEGALSPQKIAADPAHLVRILGQVDAVWEPYADKFSLPKTEDTVARASKVIETIRHDCPSCSTEFWRYYAFRELEIRLI